MRVVVTGAAGFVGSHLTKKLLSEGHEVFALDSFSDYYAVPLKNLRTKELILPVGGKVLNLDLCNLEKVKAEVEAFGPDAVIHLAAQPGVRLKAIDYHRYTSSNLVAFSNLYQIVLSLGISNFIYASSSSVYGNTPDTNLSELAQNLDPVSYYGATKLCNEALARTGDKISGLSTLGLRFFTVYGPYGRPDMAYFRLIAQALTDYKFELYGDGSILRDFTYIDDTVQALYLLLLEQEKGKLKGSHIFNVGGGKPASMLDMITQVEKLAGKKLDYVKKKSHSGDVLSTSANTIKLKEAINFIPEINLLDGLDKTFTWSNRREIRENLENWARSVD
jgi:UDP-glucuronate 4-epimerase